jgi:hypothetical protein
MSNDRRMEAINITIYIKPKLDSLTDYFQIKIYLNPVIGNVLKSIRNGVYATPNVDPGRGAYF